MAVPHTRTDTSSLFKGNGDPVGAAQRDLECGRCSSVVARRYLPIALKAGRIWELDNLLSAFDEDGGRLALHDAMLEMLKNGGDPFPDSRPLRDRESGITMEQPVKVWETTEPPPREFVVRGLIPSQATSILYGDGGMYKSFIALYLGMQVVRGAPFLNRDVIPGRVLYVDAELDEPEFRRRAYAVARGLGLEQPAEDLYYSRLPGSLANAMVSELVQEVVTDYKPVLTILDSLTVAAYGENVSDVAQTTRIMKALEGWGTVLALDHIPAPQPGANQSQASPFGSRFKYNMARSVIQSTRAEAGGLFLRQKKNNFGPIAEPLGVSIDFANSQVTFSAVGLDDDSLAGIEQHMSATDKVERALSRTGRANPQELAEALDMTVKTVRNHLTVLRRQKRAEPIGGGEWTHVPDSRSPSSQESGIGLKADGSAQDEEPSAKEPFADDACSECGSPVCKGMGLCGRCRARALGWSKPRLQPSGG